MYKYSFRFKKLETPRLILRRFREEDIDTFVGYRSNPEIAKYQSWDNYTREQGIEFIDEMLKLEPNVPGSWFQMAIELKETGEMIGDCALHTVFYDPQQVEIGYTIDSKYQNKGYGKEAVSRLLDYVFNELKKHRAAATVDVRNIPSVNLLESIGMRREGHFIENIWFKGEYGDEYVYAVLKREWINKGK